MFAQPTSPEIEHRLVVDLSNRGAMRTLDVVGEDLELWLRVDLRILRQQKRLVGLLRVGLLSGGPDDNLAVEDRASMIAENTLVHLPAATVGFCVIDRRVIVDQPSPVSQVEAVQRALRAFSVEHDVDVVPDE